MFINKRLPLTLIGILFILNLTYAAKTADSSASPINLAGSWRYALDSANVGIKQGWFKRDLSTHLHLPGSLTTNGIGNDIDVATPWTGSIFDSSWYNKPQYAKYRKRENLKVPFWLQPIKYYKGAAWYQRNITIPNQWKGKSLSLFIERSHWETTVWIDDKEVETKNSLGTPDVFDLQDIQPGNHRLTIRISNDISNLNVGENSHSISDHTQGNWNGMIGRIELIKKDPTHISLIKVYPDIDHKQIKFLVRLSNRTTTAKSFIINAIVNIGNKKLPVTAYKVRVDSSRQEWQGTYNLTSEMKLWDEFHPNIYQLHLTLIEGKKALDKTSTSFGMREFKTRGTQFEVNKKLTFLRGTLDCAAFPLTGFPPTDINAWMKIFKKIKSYGLNHIRFHSWCPPEAAFAAADQIGLYLQIECCSWANWGTTIGDGKPVDNYIYQESERIVDTYGNHPSFCMLAYGNEPGGKNYTSYLRKFVTHWKSRDSRRLYTTAAGWPIIVENDYNSTSDPRIQQWEAGLTSLINAKSPNTEYDWRNIISKWKQPTVSHEIGQWCVYPDFDEMSKYTGILKPKNFEIFLEQLNSNGLGQYAKDFLNASGHLQSLCYKADIEAALRTPKFGGFQLLSLSDFPGQGTALVGVLNAFWQDKGYINGRDFSKFCNAVVPLARFPKLIYSNDQVLDVPVELAQFSSQVLKNVVPSWKITNEKAHLIASGNFTKQDLAVGNGIYLGKIHQSLNNINQPQRLILTVNVGQYENTWDFYVYPSLPKVDPGKVIVTNHIDASLLQKIKDGSSVLYTIPKVSSSKSPNGNVALGFSTIFWNTAWTHQQPPVTMGIFCDPSHAALKYFPTQKFSNYQWWDGMAHGNAIMLDSLTSGLKPIVRIIDDWVTARSLGLLVECKIGKGKLMISGVDLLKDTEHRLEAKQLLYSLTKYMNSTDFNPEIAINPEALMRLQQNFENIQTN